MLRNERNKISSDIERKVIVQPLGKCDVADPREWPSGEFLASICQTFTEQERLSSACVDHNRRKSTDHRNIHEWWQASARRAILQKFGYFVSNSDHFTGTSDDDKKSVDLTFVASEIDGVQRLWEKVVIEIMDQHINRSVNEEEISHFFVESVDLKVAQDELSLHHPDFIDVVLNKCNKSNGRQLQWSMMSCPRGVQFPLHAHPNLELIFCKRGELFEIRMDGDPITRTFEKSETSSDDSETNPSVNGPNLTKIKRNWSFKTLKAGQWLVNEIGSVHKSFTSVRSDGGCELLVLWGGSHANIVEPPISPNIQNVVDEIEDKLQVNDSCCMNSKIHIVPDTFLPNSER